MFLMQHPVHGVLLFSSPGSSSVAYLVSHHRSVGYREQRFGFNAKHRGTLELLRCAASCSASSSARNFFMFASAWRDSAFSV